MVAVSLCAIYIAIEIASQYDCPSAVIIVGFRFKLNTQG